MMKVYELAQEYNAPKDEFVVLLKNNNIRVSNEASEIPDDTVSSFKRLHSKADVRKGIQAIKEKKAAQEADLTPQKKKAHAKKVSDSSEKDHQKNPSKTDNHIETAQQKKGDTQEKGNSKKKENKQIRQSKQKLNNQESEQAHKPHQNQKKQNNPKASNTKQKQKKNEQAGTQEKHYQKRQNKAQGQRGQEQSASASSSNNKRRRNKRNRQKNQNTENTNNTNQKKNSDFSASRNNQKSNSQGQQSKNRPTNKGRHSRPSMGGKPNPQNAQASGKKSKKNYKDKKAERPIKLRDNRKRTKNKRVDYRKQREERQLAQKKNKVYEIPEMLTVAQLADTLDIPATEVITVLMQNGTMATINQQIDAETAEIVASEMGYEVQKITTEDVFEKIFEEYDKTVTGNEIKRPPVVTVMGHVDHGKTSLLDQIRKTNVTAGEAGGITQHIGAYTVRVGGEKITFIDTPGHAAFTAMRSRGAQMTDLAVLVVAADDSVKPQTVEAINHAKAAEVPILVAINKIDKPGANPEKVKQDLTEYGLLVEEWGGDTLAVPISAKDGTNINELLENILLLAEMEELKADPKRPARGAVIEAEVKKGKGPTASLLIQQGTLEVGDSILSGYTYGKIRTMIDDKGKRIRRAGPSTPVEISGLSELPEAGDDFIVLNDEKEARSLAEKRYEMHKLELQHMDTVTLNDLFNKIREGEITEVNLIIKADVQGSVEALTQALERLNEDHEEVRVNVIHGAVGAVNETDVMLAATAKAVIIAFNVRSDRIAKAAAERDNVDVRYYTVIYDAIEDVNNAMIGLLEPKLEEVVLGEAEVREVFRLPGGQMVAGSYVTNGRISRNDQARVLRDGVIIYQSNIQSLRRFKDDVREVPQSYECGIIVEKLNDVKVGDVIEVFKMEEINRES